MRLLYIAIALLGVTSSSAHAQRIVGPASAPDKPGPLAELRPSAASRAAVVHRFVLAEGTTGRLAGPVVPTAHTTTHYSLSETTTTLSLQPGVYILDFSGDAYREDILLQAGLIAAVPANPWEGVLPLHSLEVGSYASVVRGTTPFGMAASVSAVRNPGCGGEASASVRIRGGGFGLSADAYRPPSSIGGNFLPGFEYEVMCTASSTEWCGPLHPGEGDRISSCGWANAWLYASSASGNGCSANFSFSDCNPGWKSVTCIVTGGPALTYLNDPPTTTWMIF